jgi:hypothetical protein
LEQYADVFGGYRFLLGLVVSAEYRLARDLGRVHSVANGVTMGETDLDPQISPNSLEGLLKRLKDSGITWLVAGVVGLTVVGALNARGLFDDVAAIKLSEAKFESSQAKVNDNQNNINQKLLDFLTRQEVVNQKLQDQTDLLRALVESRKSP